MEHGVTTDQLSINKQLKKKFWHQSHVTVNIASFFATIEMPISDNPYQQWRLNKLLNKWKAVKHLVLMDL